jgi:hypothetical protein
MMAAEKAPFSLDGGRAGDEGGASTAPPSPTNSLRAKSAPEWAPKKTHGAYTIPRSRRLRQDMTIGEKYLWKALRALKLNIRRQAPLVAELSPPSPALPPSRGKGES